MKKTLALILALAMCIALLAGCGGSTTGGSTTGGSTTGGSTTGGDTAKTDEKVYTLTVVNHDSASSLGEQWLEGLLNALAEESGGRLQFNYQAGGSLFGASETIDAVKDGAADICWATTGTYGGIFPVTEFINLVGNGISNGQLASAVLNTMYKEIPEVANEFKSWHVLALHGTSLSPISTATKKIETPNDLKGLRLRAAGSIPTMYVNALGATAVALPTSEVYDNLSKNALDGMLNDWHNIDCFRLYEPIKYCLDVGTNMTASFVLMNQAKYDSLPEDLQALFVKYFDSGYAADMAGYYWDSCRYWVADKMRENNVEVYEPSEELNNYLFSDEVLSTVRQGYIDYLNGKNLDGAALVEKCEAIVDRLAPEYANVWDSEFNYTDWDTSKVEGYQPKW